MSTRNGNNLRTDLVFGGSTFIGVNMSYIRTNNGMIRTKGGLEAQDIRCGSIPDKKSFCSFAKFFLKLLNCFQRNSIMTIGWRGRMIGLLNPGEYFRMNS